MVTTKLHPGRGGQAVPREASSGQDQPLRGSVPPQHAPSLVTDRGSVQGLEPGSWLLLSLSSHEDAFASLLSPGSRPTSLSTLQATNQEGREKARPVLRGLQTRELIISSW